MPLQEVKAKEQRHIKKEKYIVFIVLVMKKLLKSEREGEAIGALQRIASQ